jgi:hypothetical protein
VSVLDDAQAIWWYEQEGRQAGPVTAAALARLVAEGRLLPAHLVWKDGMAGWAPVSSVAELAPALEAAPRTAIPAPPPMPPPMSTAPAPRPAAFPGVPGAAAALEEMSVPGVILLSFVTFCIYGWVKFFETGRGYEALAARTSRFAYNFWLSIGLALVGALFAAHFVFGFAFTVASGVFTYLTLSEALTVRAEALRRAGIAPALTSEGTHKALLLAGMVLSFAVVGVVLLVVQAVRWFQDWNTIVRAVRARGPGAAA